MKKYKLLQDYKSPWHGIKKDTVKPAADWYAIFVANKHGNPKPPFDYHENSAAEWCDENRDWFEAEKPQFPTKEEIIEEEYAAMAEEINLAGFKINRKSPDVNMRYTLKMLEKHEQSIIEQLIEKIDEVSLRMNYPLVASTGDTHVGCF